MAYVVETRCDPQCDLATVRRENSFTVLDLTTRLTPRRRGAVRVRDEVPIAVPSPIAVAGRFAYLVEFAAGLQVIDISNPDAPLLVGRIGTPSQVLNVVTADSLLYVTDLIFGLQVMQGPTDMVDMDGDGVIDFFDVFPTNPAEYRDTDGDGVGDNTDPDADNDGFTNTEEVQADPPTDPMDPQSYPLTLPPEGTTEVFVDAGSSSPTRARNGMTQTPYRSITEGLRAVREALRAGRPITTLSVRAGSYSSQTTQESFPINLFGLSHFTMQGAGLNTTVIDAGFAGVVIVLGFSTQTTLEGFTLRHGAYGLVINEGQKITLRQNRIAEHIFSGIIFAFNGSAEISQNIIESSGESGIGLDANALATIRENHISDSDDGIAVRGRSTAIITANVISQNTGNGITIAGGAFADITSGTITGNGGAGIFITNDGSLAHIDRTRIMFDSNVRGEIVGSFQPPP
jgi:hypothetical protein